MSMFKQESTKRENRIRKLRMRLMGDVLLGTKNAAAGEELTDNILYDTVNVYAKFMNLKVAPLSVIENIYSYEYDVYDIARASDITFRRVTLDKKQINNLQAPILAFLSETNEPVIIIPYSIGKANIISVDKGTAHPITADEAEKLSDTGIYFYKSLPSEKLSIKDVLKFGFKNVRVSEVAEIAIMMIATTLTSLLIPYMNEQVFDHYIPHGEIDEILRISFVIISCIVANALISIIKNRASFRLSSNVSYTISNATIDRVFKLPQSYIERNNATDLVIRASSMGDSIGKLINGGISVTLGLILSILYLIRMHMKAPKLMWWALLMVLITIVIIFLTGWASIKKENLAVKEDMKAKNKLFQYIAGIQTVRLSGIEERVLYEYQLNNVESARLRMRAALPSNVRSTIMEISTTVYSLVFFLIVMISDMKQLSIGEFSSFISSFSLFTGAVTNLASFMLSAVTGWPVLKLAEPIYAQEPEGADYVAEIEDFKGELEVKELSFAYNEDEPLIIDNISFHVKRKEYIGIVGKTGSGKTTLLRLLLGFEKPTAGKILYDGKDSSQLNMKSIRKQTGVVLQQGGMMLGSIYENVAVANPKLTKEDVEELLVEAGMALDLERMPMGVDTLISEFGGSVSGGQQQRILIARALANNPSILYFDEATSALDNNAQKAISNDLKKRNITRVIIAHRLSTVMECDRILFLDNGKVAEEGTYEELMAKKGLFYEMAKRQEV